MKNLISMLLAGLFAIAAVAAQAELVGTPVIPSSGTLHYTATFQQSVTGAESYVVQWTKNDVVAATQSVSVADFPADGVFLKSLTVVTGDVVCAQIAAVNGGGQTAFDRQCMEPAFTNLPPLPDQPLTLSVAFQ